MSGRWTLAALLVLLAIGPAQAQQTAPESTITIVSSHRRASPGDTVVVRIDGSGDIRAALLAPGGGATPLDLRRDGTHLRASIALPADAAEGLYAVHAWTGSAGSPHGVGKAFFLVGRIVLDFFIPRYLDRTAPHADLDAYLDDFGSLGGNTLIAHALITPDTAYFPSRIARRDPRHAYPDDMVEALLTRADERGVAVLLSVSWDMTRKTPYSGRMAEIEALMTELWGLYRHHPSLVGFYSYQEGSGTYYAPYVRDFTAAAKGLHGGLLTAVAPFLDDPLLAGYLSTVDTLDMMIYQGMVMASYRPDNRKLFPLRRVRDFAALGIGAKWLQDKFAVVHVELFAYAEKRRAPDVIAAAYDDIYRQILSVATASAADGIALFAYGPHIHAARRDPLVQRSREAVRDGLALFRRITSGASAEPQPFAVYVSYSDWIVERWTQNIVPGLDAFRLAGVAVDVLPYAPPMEESHYPYFPFHMNPDVLERLLRTRTVLLLPDISGFQQTDSDLFDAFIQRGGVVVAFGPQIPMGRSYERDVVFGGAEGGRGVRRAIRVTEPTRRTKDGATRTLAEPLETPAWRAGSGRVVATFDDGTPAVIANRHGEGLAVTVLPSAAQLAGAFPELLRDVLDIALRHAGREPLVDVEGLNEASDVAVRMHAGGIDLAVVNHDAAEQRVRIEPPTPGGEWIDVRSGRALPAEPGGEIRMRIPPADAAVLEYRNKAGGR